MKTSLTTLVLITSLLTLISCGQKSSPKTLEISSTMALTSAGFTGGLIAYGEGPNGEKFAASSAAGQNLSVTINDGTWKIYVMGWEETNGLKFRGTKYCGMSTINLASADTSVNVEISSTNCSDINHPLVVDAAPQNVLVSSCGAFYKYTTGTDAFAGLAPGDGDGFCSNLPKNLQGSFDYYRLVAINQQGASAWPGLGTECISTDVTTNTRVMIPTRKFPFQVQMYRSLKDCQNTASPRMAVFPFPNGVEQGNQTAFDHHFQVTTAPNARLFLPSSMTRRGYSPFMGILPRVLCGTSPSLTDCFAAPNVPTLNISPFSAIQFDIPWDDKGGMNYDRGMTFIKKFATTNTNASTCPSTVVGLLNSNPNFGLKSCRIENGDVIGELGRNVFTCRSSSSDIVSVVDLYEKNGLIYLVHQISTDYKISIYSNKGLPLGLISLPASSGTFESMATDSSNNIYALMNTGGSARTIYKYTYSSSTQSYSQSSFTSATYSHLSSVNEIEITPGGVMITATATDLSAASLSTFASAATPFTVPGNTPVIKKLLYRDNYLYFLTHSDSNTYSNVFDATISGTSITIGNSNAPQFVSSYLHQNFHISTVNSNRFLALSPITVSGVEMRVYPISSANVVNTGGVITKYSIPAVGTKIIMAGDMIYGLNGSNFETYQLDTTTPGINTAQTITGTCDGQLTGTIDATAYAITVQTKTNSGVKIAFDEAYRFAGRRTVSSENALTYFESLRDGKDNEVRTGGLLARAEEMLGPNGLGGVINAFYPGQTCAQIKAALPATGAVSRSISLFDLYDGKTFNFTMSLSKPSTQVHNFVCSGYPSVCGAEYYDLTVDFASVDERMKIQINCSTKLGALESVESKDANEVRRSLLLWNTNSSSSVRAENYEIEDRIENTQQKAWIHVSKLQKSVPSLDKVEVRSLELNRDSSYIEGRVNEFYIDDYSGLKIMSSAAHTGLVTAANFNSSNSTTIDATTIGAVVSNAYMMSIDSNAGVCINNTDTSVTSSNQSCILPTSTFTMMSMGTLAMTLDDLKFETDPVSNDLTNSSLHSIFTLSAP